LLWSLHLGVTRIQFRAVHFSAVAAKSGICASRSQKQSQMDQYTRRIIGFGVQAVAVDGPALCRMFNQTISGQGLPTRLSNDHDPLFQFHRWRASLRILDVETVQTVLQVS
jgi:hypothetical protein